MKRPSPVSFLIGKKLAVGVGSVAAVLLVYGWASGQLAVPWPIPFVAVGFALRAWRAKRDIETFKIWERNWNAMAGIAEPKKRSWRDRPWAITVWFCLLLFVVAQPYADADFKGAVDVAFTFTTLWLFGKLVLRAKRFMSTGRAKSGTQSTHVVRVCLPLPTSTPGIREITAALPDYCLALLRRQRELSPQR